MCFSLVIVLTAETFAFTYDGSGPNPHLDDSTVGAFPDAQSAPLSFETISEFSYTYAVFDVLGEQITELDETTQLTRFTTIYAAEQAGQNISINYLESSYMNGYEHALEYFQSQGGLPEGSYLGAVSSSDFVNQAFLTANYVNECGSEATFTAVTDFENSPA